MGVCDVAPVCSVAPVGDPPLQGLNLDLARRDGFDARPGSAHGDALHTGVCEPCRPLVACGGKHLIGHAVACVPGHGHRPGSSLG